MLLIYVITAVIGYVIYTVIKLKAEEWFEEIRMSKLRLKKYNLNDEESEMQNSTAIDEKHTIEISSDESSDDIMDQTEYNTNTLLQFQKSTDSVTTDEDEEEPIFASKSNLNSKGPMFSWGQKSIGLKQNNEAAYSDFDSDDDKQWYDVKKKKLKRQLETELKTELKTELETELPNTSEGKAACPEVIPHYEQMIAGIKVKLPVKPYSCQIAVMNKLIQGCTKGENCLLESPTGSGKTLALLCAVLAWHDRYSGEVRKRIAELENGLNVVLSGQSSSGCCEAQSRDGLEKMKNTKAPKIPKIYYGTRTHKQIEQVVRELRKTSYKHKKMTILSSREHTCIQESNKNKTELCNDLLDPQKHLGCKFYNESNKKSLNNFHVAERHGLSSVWDIEDLVAIGRKTQLCPYFAARNLMDFADIIFCPYNYIIDPDIRSSLQMDLSNQVIILDEAHNIEDICRDVASVDFREDYLEIAANECKDIGNARTNDPTAYKNLQAYFLKLAEFLKSTVLKKIEDYSDRLSSPYWSGTELLELFNMHDLGETAYPSFFNACSSAIEDFNKMKDENRMQPVGKFVSEPVISTATKILVEHLMFAMRMILNSEFANDYRACVTEDTVKNAKFAMDNTWFKSKKMDNRLRTLKLLCMNPGVIFAPLAQSARCIILASGTLTPTTSFQSELNTKFTHVLNTGHVIPKEQVYATCISKGPKGVSLRATYNIVNSWAFQDELGEVLVDVCESVPHGVLCFFSSYNTMNMQVERWRKTSIWSKIVNIKQVFIEPRYGGDLKGIMDEYRGVIKYTSTGPSGGINGALFLAVFRGKVAEGIDFRDEEARCVITVGIPYAVRKDPVIAMKLKYNDMNTERGLLKGSDWYSIQAFRALNQALGRCLRHVKDWGAVLLVDERFLMPDSIKNLPKWVKTMWIHQTRYDLKQQLRDFVDRQKAREERDK
nr:Fanconi anemia group J protein-like [Megalopta genalis]